MHLSGASLIGAGNSYQAMDKKLNRINKTAGQPRGCPAVFLCGAWGNEKSWRENMSTKLIILIGIVLLSVCALSYLAILVAKKAISQQNRKLSHSKSYNTYSKNGASPNWSHSSFIGGSGVAQSPEPSEQEMRRNEDDQIEKEEVKRKNIAQALAEAKIQADIFNAQRQLNINLHNEYEEIQEKRESRDFGR
ncbi:hypothetical protein RBH76_10660 [Oscillospiraceae bacterium MB24-C1]|nr:hypothetical protein RBH76_10660 [Oscillospiraceae bacterium MB24-C1]